MFIFCITIETVTMDNKQTRNVCNDVLYILTSTNRSKMAFDLREKEEEYRVINQQLQLKTQQLLQEANQVIVSSERPL